MAKLEGTTPQQARSRCAKALVGEGDGRGAGADCRAGAGRKISSPLSFFNAPPTGGRPTIIAHAYETIPKPKTLLVPIVIEKVNGGRYGYRAEVELPEIAEGYGSAILAEATIGLTYKHGGREGRLHQRHAAAAAACRCTGKLIFANGDFFPATLTSPCHVAALRARRRSSLLAPPASPAAVASAPRPRRRRRTVVYNNLVLHADGGFQPQTLPRQRLRADQLPGRGRHLDRSRRRPARRPGRSGDRLRPRRPPRRRRPADLRRRRRSRALGTAAARAACGGAMVGEGEVEAVVGRRGAAPVSARADDLQRPRRSRPPDRGPPRPPPAPPPPDLRDPGADRTHRPGEFRYRVTLRVPPLAGGLGSLTRIDVDIGRRYRAGGERRSYVSARCTRQHPPHPRPLHLRRRHDHRRQRRKVLPRQQLSRRARRGPRARPSYNCPVPGR